jgi:hypothetical protein
VSDSLYYITDVSEDVHIVALQREIMEYPLIHQLIVDDCSTHVYEFMLSHILNVMQQLLGEVEVLREHLNVANLLGGGIQLWVK